MAQRKIKANCQVQVQLRPEPTYGKDKNIIAIDLNHGNGWFNCYIAREFTGLLHTLIENEKLLTYR